MIQAAMKKYISSTNLEYFLMLSVGKLWLLVEADLLDVVLHSIQFTLQCRHVCTLLQSQAYNMIGQSDTAMRYSGALPPYHLDKVLWQ